MWALVPRKTQTLIVGGTAILIAWALDAVWQLLGGAPAGPLKWISLTATIIATLLGGIAGLIWRPVWRRFPAIERNTFPDLNGTWKGHLKST